MNKIVLLSFIIPFLAYSQKVTTSPYSNFGYGELKYNNAAGLAGMASNGTSYVSPFKNEINLSNPAGNAFLETTAFEIGGNSDLARYKSNAASEKNGANYVSTITLAIPFAKRFTISGNFQPYSGTGYSLNTINTDGITTVKNAINGDGGINSLGANLSYMILKDKSLAVGVNSAYLFGNIERKQQLSFNEQALVTEYRNEDDIKGFNWVFGVIYRKKLKKDKFLNFGANYSFEQKLDNSSNRSLITYVQNTNGVPITSTADTVNLGQTNTKFTMPAKASLGIAYENPKHYSLGIQYDFEKMSVYNALDLRTVVQYDDKHRIALGGYYIPKFNAANNFFKTVTYRFGTYYEKTGLNINNGGDFNAINAYGLTLGLGLPVGKDKSSNLNIALDLGQKGTSSNGLVKENYAKIKFSFVINNQWLKKKVYY